MNKWKNLEQKIGRLQTIMVAILFGITATILTAAVDYLGAEPKLNTAQVVYKKFIPKAPLNLEDPCQETLDPDCIYRAGHSQTMYGMVVVIRDRARIFPVPKSYFYTVEENHHIPVYQKRGFLTGLIYSEQIDYPIHNNIPDQ